MFGRFASEMIRQQKIVRSNCCEQEAYSCVGLKRASLVECSAHTVQCRDQDFRFPLEFQSKLSPWVQFPQKPTSQQLSVV